MISRYLLVGGGVAFLLLAAGAAYLWDQNQDLAASNVLLDEQVRLAGAASALAAKQAEMTESVLRTARTRADARARTAARGLQEVDRAADPTACPPSNAVRAVLRGLRDTYDEVQPVVPGASANQPAAVPGGTVPATGQRDTGRGGPVGAPTRLVGP